MAEPLVRRAVPRTRSKHKLKDSCAPPWPPKTKEWTELKRPSLRPKKKKRRLGSNQLEGAWGPK